MTWAGIGGDRLNSNKEILADLKERLKAIPQLPGVYLFKNANQDVIYVGKARSLRNRLRSYFQDQHLWQL